MNLPEIITQMRQLVDDTANYIRTQRDDLSDDQLTEKSFNNFVTTVDQGAEELLVAGLKKILPSAGFITEEGTETSTAEYQWVIDPIDGTTNFIHHIPIYAISIGLIRNGEEIVLGVILEINQNECFYAWKGGSAWLNDKKINVSETTELKRSLIATGFPYDDFEVVDEYHLFLKALMSKSRGIRRLGSAAVDLAYVACGRFDCFYEYGLNPWDICAGILIVQEAGGEISDFKNDGQVLFEKEIVATNGHIHEELTTFMKSYFQRLTPTRRSFRKKKD